MLSVLPRISARMTISDIMRCEAQGAKRREQRARSKAQSAKSREPSGKRFRFALCTLPSALCLPTLIAQRTSIRRCPASRSITTWGHRDHNHCKSARLVALPTRSQTITGLCGSRPARSAKSSSLVKITAPTLSAYAQMGSSSALRNPTSSTCCASCPCSHNQRAKAGGN